MRPGHGRRREAGAHDGRQAIVTSVGVVTAYAKSLTNSLSVTAG